MSMVAHVSNSGNRQKRNKIAKRWRAVCVVGIAGLLLRAGMVRAEDATPEGADNTRPENAQLISDEADVQVQVRDQTEHYFRLNVPRHSVYRLTVEISRSGNNPHDATIYLTKFGARREAYRYQLRDLRAKPQYDKAKFFPVLDAAGYTLEVDVWGEKPWAGSVRFHLEPVEVKALPLTDAERGQAKDSLQKALAFLAAGKPEQDRDSYPTAVEALAMAALAEGKDGESRKGLIEQRYLPYLEKQMDVIDSDVKEGGKPVKAVSSRLYEAAITTLAAAEVSGEGSARAKALCLANARFLILSQIGPRRPKQWGGNAANDPRMFGGWRYNRDARDADISVTGWCAIGLIAADAAGVKVPDTREALADASKFVRECTYDKGFDYQPGHNDPEGNIRAAIGSLLMTMDAQDSPMLETALDDVDAHLPAGIQVDLEDNYPLYYAYYGTRLNYLRGGFAWQAWRRAMVEQLLLWQRADGSYRTFGNERDMNPRYGAALGAMVMRICLEDVPAYLKVEARGF